MSFEMISWWKVLVLRLPVMLCELENAAAHTDVLCVLFTLEQETLHQNGVLSSLYHLRAEVAWGNFF